mmetsp:Transcript_7051/g.16851  ORF Transcript_7051/g.16851 Transcript_7051/m.16851 type:complete len:204 (-) Transcript_7051:73-684(-)
MDGAKIRSFVLWRVLQLLQDIGQHIIHDHLKSVAHIARQAVGNHAAALSLNMGGAAGRAGSQLLGREAPKFWHLVLLHVKAPNRQRASCLRSLEGAIALGPSSALLVGETRNAIGLALHRAVRALAPGLALQLKPRRRRQVRQGVRVLHQLPWSQRFAGGHPWETGGHKHVAGAFWQRQEVEAKCRALGQGFAEQAAQKPLER